VKKFGHPYLVGFWISILWLNATGYAGEHVSITVDLNRTFQQIDNFGASDCWSMQMIGGWSEENRNHVADLLFSRSAGIGLSCWRFNIGAGKPSDIPDPWRSAETFEIAEGEYDWSRQANEQWFLAAAKARGVERFVAFVNSPPARMTRNGRTHCSPDSGTTNLREGYERQYAGYLADILAYFHHHPDERYRVDFDWISPVNEPQWDWNDNSQEGNRASNADIRKIILALHEALNAKNLKTRILFPESGSIANFYLKEPRATRLYSSEYGNYLQACCGDPEIVACTGKVICAHAYWTDLGRALESSRKRLRAALDAYPEWQYWQTEYCPLLGTDGKGGGGRDLTMETALHTARVIHSDLTICNASAWHWWLAVSSYQFKDGLIYTDYRQKGDPETIYPSKTLWVLGHFSRFIRPGSVRLETRGTEKTDGLLVSAYRRQDGRELIVVLVNTGEMEWSVHISVNHLPKGMRLDKFTPWMTSETDDLREYPAFSKSSPFKVPPRSVVTLTGEISPK